MKCRLESLVEQWQDTEYWQENQEHIIITVGTFLLTLLKPLQFLAS